MVKEIGGKLILMTNRKSHMRFRLVPNSVTLNDLERRNSSNRRVISPNSVAFRAHYVKVVEDIHRHFLRQNFFFIAIFAKVTENECVIMRMRSHVTACHHYNITYLLLLANSTMQVWFYYDEIFVNFGWYWAVRPMTHETLLQTFFLAALCRNKNLHLQPRQIYACNKTRNKHVVKLHTTTL